MVPHNTPLADAMLSTTFGRFWIQCSDRGLTALEWRESSLGSRRSSTTHHSLGNHQGTANAALEDVATQLTEYLAGTRREFLLRIDNRCLQPFQKKVFDALADVPFGETATYGEIARRIRHPLAARAVGNALGANPICIVIPCHRVLRAGGQLGGYGGGIDRKVALLELEASVASQKSTSPRLSRAKRLPISTAFAA